LTPEAFDFGDCHSFDADFAEGIFDLLQLERLYYRFDFLHLFMARGAFARGCFGYEMMSLIRTDNSLSSGDAMNPDKICKSLSDKY